MKRQTFPADPAALRDALLAQLGQQQVIETPQLGRIESKATGDILKALQYLDQQTAAAAGGGATGTIIIVADRGLS